VRGVALRSPGDAGQVPGVFVSRPSAVGRSAGARNPGTRTAGARHELPATSAVPPGIPCRRAHDDQRGGGRSCAVPQVHTRCVARRAALGHRGHARYPGAELAIARRAEPGRRSLGGRGTPCAGATPARRVAGASRPALGRPWRHRLRGDRAEWPGFRDRDENPKVRPTPPRSGARAGSVARPSPAEVVWRRGASCPVRGARGGSGALRAGHPRGLDRPARPRAVGHREPDVSRCS
jgi:hypothetical protein